MNDTHHLMKLGTDGCDASGGRTSRTDSVRSSGSRRRRLSAAVLLGALFALGAVFGTPAGLAAAENSLAETMPIEEIEAGQKGYGLSVFRGREPVRFEVEVVGVIENMRPGTSFVLARLSGRGLEETGVIAGMSGSPVYIDDRLVGAVAFGWPFSLEAIAGITPISTMRLLSEGDPDFNTLSRRAHASAIDFESIVRGDLPESLLVESLSVLKPKLAEGAKSGLLWHLNGFSPAAHQMLSEGLGVSEGLGAMVSGGSTQGGGPETLQPGGAVAGVLVHGDLNMAATGTVTDRIGDEVFAFGHPFLGLGPTSLPMATADIVTILGSRYSSFKISNVGEVVGAFNVDRAAGIRGRIGLEAPTVPLVVTVRGDREQTYEMELADLPSVTPGLVAVSLISALDETTQSAGRAGVDLVAKFEIGDHGELNLRQSFDGDSASVQAAIYLMAITGFLEQNGFGPVDLESVEVDLKQFAKPRTLRLVSGHSSQSLVRPGETVTVTLDMTDPDGFDSRRSLDVTLPTGLPSGRYSLLVGDGASANAARLAIEQTNPVTLEQALEYFRRLHSQRDLVALGVFAEPGLSVAGEVMPQLPGSMRSIWGAAASNNAKSVGLAIAQEIVEPLELPLLGMIRIDLEVRRSEPSSGDAAGGSEGGEGAAGSVGTSGSSSRVSAAASESTKARPAPETRPAPEKSPKRKRRQSQSQSPDQSLHQTVQRIQKQKTQKESS